MDTYASRALATLRASSVLAVPRNSAARWLARLRDLVRLRWRQAAHRRRVAATRAVLASLDDRTLKDIGLSRSEIEAAAAGTLGGRVRGRAGGARAGGQTGDPYGRGSP